MLRIGRRTTGLIAEVSTSLWATSQTLPHSLEDSLQCSRIYRERTLSFATQEVTLEGRVEDYWIDLDLLDRAAGGAALHWFRT